MPARPHVLVAEDNALVADAMRVLFEGTGHRVTTCARVQETIDAATASAVDVLLLDLGLADGDGFAVLTELRARGAMPRVCVALTGRDEPEIVARCRSLGCSDALLKPVPARTLLAKVQGWVAAP